ncbi:hypothetical protein QBC33DRAFT_517247 [Phialemonium atrogriseum]|uniref:SWIM-type domain-containing protein n=1 Tax=Phialemonium atrogriseum TaxID=1093897 RepID=A0AAJ0FK09_9PEZI|nr:uncharacterized protein QBC33DRAFT_517247 [Phialemonium atrogriseum]KAK1765044.1 hypothetical protein QBC33DRAFT_517247 [Phialemonium atrogriseum]
MDRAFQGGCHTRDTDSPRKLNRKHAFPTINEIESQEPTERLRAADSHFRPEAQANHWTRDWKPSNLIPDGSPGDAADAAPLTEPKRKAKKRKLAAPPEEKRLRRFRTSPPQSFHAIHERATTQRFFVLRRTRRDTPDHPSEEIELAGWTGNLYRVTVGPVVLCDCAHARGGEVEEEDDPRGVSRLCKHIVFVLGRVLRASERYTYQLALLAKELRRIFAYAPTGGHQGDEDGRRRDRELGSGDCPICFGELDTRRRGYG